MPFSPPIWSSSKNIGAHPLHIGGLLDFLGLRGGLILESLIYNHTLCINSRHLHTLNRDE